MRYFFQKGIIAQIIVLLPFVRKIIGLCKAEMMFKLFSAAVV